MEYELYHHGIKGQKWGVRRYQNADGSLTAKGKKRYSNKEIKQDRDAIRKELASHGASNLTGDAKKAYNENQKIEKRIGVYGDSKRRLISIVRRPASITNILKSMPKKVVDDMDLTELARLIKRLLG